MNAALLVAGALAASPFVLAGIDAFLSPLMQSTAVVSPDHTHDLNSPRPAPAVVLANGTHTEAKPHEQVMAQLRISDAVKLDAPLGLHPVRTVYNHEAIIPPQCYTRTEGRFNPCYVCHQSVQTGRENSMDDWDLQAAYSFSELGMTNYWQNLFEDRTRLIETISDDEILDWIGDDNYTPLQGALEAIGFKGWMPDLQNLHLAARAFDAEGFALDGSHWVAFNYKPFPSTFWPTNGSTDDVMIRLPAAFREDHEGVYSRDVYMANLAILELTIKDLAEVSTPPIDERRIGRDLNADGELGVARTALQPRGYVGAAEDEHWEISMYPEGTELLHTLRYLGISPDGEIGPSTRIKEVRYMKKWVAYRKQVYARVYQLEGYEKELGHLPSYQYLGDKGLDNKFGWSIQGFIENPQGALRAATYEENLFCMGCHTSIGATIDKTFAFPRKIDGASGWGYIDLRGMPDAPNLGETRGEIATYLQRVGGGGEFRSNEEMFSRWFKADGTLDLQRVAEAKDVYTLITPSVERALELNKAYRAIVKEQDFIYGRDAFASAPDNVFRQVDAATAPTLAPESWHEWDIRLDWSGLHQDQAK